MTLEYVTEEAVKKTLDSIVKNSKLVTELRHLDEKLTDRVLLVNRLGRLARTSNGTHEETHMPFLDDLRTFLPLVEKARGNIGGELQ